MEIHDHRFLTAPPFLQRRISAACGGIIAARESPEARPSAHSTHAGFVGLGTLRKSGDSFGALQAWEILVFIKRSAIPDS
jgi:hypothetical protein